tara:strand:- start:382 stop:585 length:204 start_codon:yes stop_codon:yes gene_type:complete
MRNSQEYLLNIKEVMKRVTYSRSEIYRKMAANKFPKPIQLGRQRVAWRVSDVERYINNVIKGLDYVH